MFFASKQKLDQMDDAALGKRHDFLETIKKIGQALPSTGLFGGIVFGALALGSGAAKIAVALAFVGGAAVPAIIGITVGLLASVALDSVEKVQNARPSLAIAKKKEPAAKPAAAPAISNAPDLSDEFHAGVSKNVSAMKPLKFKTRPETPSVM